VELTAVLGFAAIALTLIVVPGPDWAYVLAAGTRDHVVLPAVAGIMTGYLLITLVVVVGAGPLVTGVPFALTALTLAGACYLTYLGIRTLRSVRALPGRAPTAAPTPVGWAIGGPLGYVARGIGVSALNPKGLLIFLSILPQFARTGGWPLPVQLAVLGGLFTALTGAFYLPLGYASDRVLGARPGIARTTTTIAGIAMILVGIALLAERLARTAA
jgi:threonine/homoserine/homoserine lactone efflux protein